MDLSMLPVAHGFRRCGEQVTRLGTFIAAPLFASALMGASISAYGAWRARRRPAPVHA